MLRCLHCCLLIQNYIFKWNIPVGVTKITVSVAKCLTDTHNLYMKHYILSPQHNSNIKGNCISTYWLAIHRDISTDTCGMPHTHTFIPKTYFKKYHSWLTTNTWPPLHFMKILYLVFLKKICKKQKSLFLNILRLSCDWFYLYILYIHF